MSIAALAFGGARILGQQAVTGGISRLLGRRGRKKGRAAAAVAPPTILQRAAALTGRLAGRAVDPMTGRPRRRRARGISGSEIRGFKKVSRLLSQFGMRPRGLARPMRGRARPFSRARFGDPDDGGGFEE